MLKYSPGDDWLNYFDPKLIKGGRVGFSPYSTALMIKDIEMREIYWEKFAQVYEPEF